MRGDEKEGEGTRGRRRGGGGGGGGEENVKQKVH
jgi:hypothetical protein